MFETGRPERRACEEWTADTGPVVLDVPGSGQVERRLEVTDARLPLVSFRFTYRFLADGAVVASDSTLRFRSRDEVESSLIAHGYQVLDVRDAPDRPGREFVFIAQRTTWANGKLLEHPHIVRSYAEGSARAAAIVTPSATRSRMIDHIVRRLRGSSPVVGSSRKMIRGLPTSVIARSRPGLRPRARLWNLSFRARRVGQGRSVARSCQAWPATVADRRPRTRVTCAANVRVLASKQGTDTCIVSGASPTSTGHVSPEGQRRHFLQERGTDQPFVFSHGWPLNADATTR